MDCGIIQLYIATRFHESFNYQLLIQSATSNILILRLAVLPHTKPSAHKSHDKSHNANGK